MDTCVIHKYVLITSKLSKLSTPSVQNSVKIPYNWTLVQRTSGHINSCILSNLGHTVQRIHEFPVYHRDTIFAFATKGVC